MQIPEILHLPTLDINGHTVAETVTQLYYYPVYFPSDKIIIVSRTPDKPSVLLNSMLQLMNNLLSIGGANFREDRGLGE